MSNKNITLPKFLPTLSVTSLDEAKILNTILKSANISYVELTLRSLISVEAIEYIANQDHINLGIGTVLNVNQLLSLPISKIRFVVSPGFVEEVAIFCKENSIQYIPGVETTSEIIKAQNSGYDLVKFFPAESIGSTSKLKALNSVFPKVNFMCTGGINLENYKKYIDLPNVCSVGGSFVLPKALIHESKISSAVDYLNKL
ncbi:bifunctional 4-hydroxy-2-oxoglutarate aldolase/2-dehydro-3-deoxy-phosphogluconate aldolase [Gammaproteobacteria bacterium]|jgi:2-dehydro-3-deoxyphosphogluconate aldolase/(4S)-4-hydroxy-2-oxoglutarate aldolase|nr:bifunctional 4-hydroxy-2-oxoglutarate aldolase/2-dehydro-3-deoxy-phosphogluconate aldolase [Gammaproteobacteria bacterium]